MTTRHTPIWCSIFERQHLDAHFLGLEKTRRAALAMWGSHAGPGEEFIARSGAWHAADGKMHEGQV